MNTSNIDRYPNIAELAYGHSRRGCFENPDDNKVPTRGIDCPDILPVEYADESDSLLDAQAMKNPSPLVSRNQFTIALPPKAVFCIHYIVWLGPKPRAWFGLKQNNKLG